MMTVKELKEAIAGLPDEMEVILQIDSEGNEYRPLYGVDKNSIYIPTDCYSGDVYSIELTAEEAFMSEEEWEKIKLKQRCLILYFVD